MTTTHVTYGQLDRVLRSLGFSSRLVDGKPPARHYEHKETGAFITIPPLPEAARVMEHHFVTVRVTLDGFGIATPADFAARLEKVKGTFLAKGIIRNGRVEVAEPIDLPDGAEVTISGPAAMDKIEPFDMTDEERAAADAWEKKVNDYTIANMDKGIENVFPCQALPLKAGPCDELSAMTAEPLQEGTEVKIRDSVYKRVLVAEYRGPLGPKGARVYRVQVQEKPRRVYIEVLEEQLEVLKAAESGR